MVATAVLGPPHRLYRLVMGPETKDGFPRGVDSPDYKAAFPSEPQLSSPSGVVACWFTDPPGMIIQITQRTQGTLEGAQWIGGPAIDAMLRRFSKREWLTLVLDLRLMTGREPAARHSLVAPAKSLKSRLARIVVVAPERASSIYLSSLLAATTLLSVFGYRVDLKRSLEVVVKKHRIRVAAP
ncbi:MAG TPA: hypothetical protein VH062_03050 [Polyangiaceae bacterium]|jgi:hypothetical protein|nr:hypothetical protein [Polyangiaceae bacterium]